jgi:acyl-CoA reductase-like NAD-dependent aldehyde dehydrogenase
MATAVKTLQNFVAGDWVEATGDEAREIVSPVTGEKLADAPNASERTSSGPRRRRARRSRSGRRSRRGTARRSATPSPT